MEGFAEIALVGGGDGARGPAGAASFKPFEGEGVEEGAEGLHEVVGQGGGAFPGGMADAIERIEAGGEECLEGLGEEEGVGVVEEAVEAEGFGLVAREGLKAEGFGAGLPVEAGTGAFLVGGALGAENVHLPKRLPPMGGEGVHERALVAAFGVEGLLPKGLPEALRCVDLGAGDQGVGDALDGEVDADGAEALADDHGDAVLGGFRQQVAVEGAGIGGDENRRHVLQRHLAGGFAFAAEELPVFAEQVYTVGSGDFDDVIGHEGSPVRV